jgi:hypothetical protein
LFCAFPKDRSYDPNGLSITRHIFLRTLICEGELPRDVSLGLAKMTLKHRTLSQFFYLANSGTTFLDQVTLIVSVMISIIPVSFRQIGDMIVVRPAFWEFAS